MPIHLRAEASDYAPNVLCPGDPRRATYIAETFFDPGYRCVNEERGMLGFTGTFEGKPIVYAFGIPSEAPHPELARRFARFLRSPDGRAILRREGLDALEVPVERGPDRP